MSISRLQRVLPWLVGPRFQAFPALIVGPLTAHLATRGDLALPWMLRPTLAATAIVLVLQLVATFALRSALRGAAAALALWVFVLGDAGLAAWIIVGLVALELLAFVRPHGRWLGATLPARAAHVLTVLSAAYAVVTIGSVAVEQLDLAAEAPLERGAPSAESPDIFLVVLDGYPRADTLRDLYGFDNGPFIGELEELGFEVASESRANYNQTILTLASMLGMRHVGDIDELAAAAELDAARQYRELTRFLSQPPVVEQLRARGYEVAMIPSPFLNIAVRSADRMLDTGHLSWYEIDRLDQIARSGPLGRSVADFVAGQHRDRISQSFEIIRQEAARSAEHPRFVIAHLMAPHAPFVFDATGNPVALPECFPKCSFWSGWVSQQGVERSEFNARASGQIEYVNSETLSTVRQILEGGDDPIVIVMSDHGSRLDPSDPDEMLRNFIATYTPGQRELFGDRTTPIAIFPRILNAYLGAEIDEPPPSEFFNDGAPLGPLEIRPYSAPPS